ATVLKNFINRKYKNLYLNLHSNFILSILYFLPNVILLSYGGYLVVGGQLTIGSLVALSTYLQKLYSPIRELSNINFEIQKSLVSYNRYYELINVNDNAKKDQSKYYELKDSICLESVNFSYSGKKNIFCDLSYRIKLGSTVQISGCNGKGKTTLLDLMAGLLRPCSGNVFIDNIPIKNIDNQSLKKLLGIVPQNVYLFNDTIKNNIILDKEISDTEILELSNKLGYNDVTNSTETNLYTMVSNIGNNLSGGQKQKIAILRAIIHNPSIIILDEPSTFLDEPSRIKLFMYLSTIKKHKLIIISSHDQINHLPMDYELNMNSNVFQKCI
ncbi:MAG: ABC transporter ATP-binding protein, partial [Sulfolobales archaeon]